MYDWRKLTKKEREAILRERIQKGFPYHRPPHFYDVSGHYHIAGTCYEHAHFIGFSPKRMLDFAHSLLDALAKMKVEVHAWCVLPNHITCSCSSKTSRALWLPSASFTAAHHFSGTAKRTPAVGKFGITPEIVTFAVKAISGRR
jgi:REP element-mobilizing transposase RayT